MNLILFEADELDRPLARDDPRARHILDVLRRQAGETFDAGIVDGPRGKATVRAITPESVALEFDWAAPAATLPAITLIVGLPRPQTARDILRDATSLGVTAMEFVRTEKADASYAESRLWTSGEWRHRLLAGAAQAFDTRIPAVRHGHALLEALATMAAGSTRLALDNYESPIALGRCDIASDVPIVLAVGSERGWSARERAALREHNFRFAHLGTRVLRTETAVIAALSIIRARQGFM